MNNNFLPYITILRCKACHTHQWCTRHIEQQYKDQSELIQNAIQDVLTDLVRVTVNELVEDANMHSENVKQIARWIAKDKIPIGAMEIYFMDTCLYSKKINNTWPSARKMAEKCRVAYQLWQENADFKHLKHMNTSDRMRHQQSVAQLTSVGSEERLYQNLNGHIQSHPTILTINEMNSKQIGRYRNNAVTTMSTAKHEYGGGMINTTRDSYRSRTPINGKSDGGGHFENQRSGSMSKFKIKTIQYDDKPRGMKNTTSMRTLAPSASASTFKNRNLITLEDCAATFRVIWDGVMNQAKEGTEIKHKFNPEDYMHKDQLNQLVLYAAEILNKQDLCPRDNPARNAYVKYIKDEKCNCRQQVASIKKIPKLLFQVFNTQADECRITQDELFIKYYTPQMTDDIFNDLMNIVFKEFISDQQQKNIIHCVLNWHEECISNSQYTKKREITKGDVEFILDLINANNLLGQIPDDIEGKPELAPLKQSEIDIINKICHDQKSMNQDQLKDGLRQYLHKIKSDAQNYIDNGNINFGDQNENFDKETQDIYSNKDCQDQKFVAPKGSRVFLALKVVNQLKNWINHSPYSQEFSIEKFFDPENLELFDLTDYEKSQKLKENYSSECNLNNQHSMKILKNIDQENKNVYFFAENGNIHFNSTKMLQTGNTLIGHDQNMFEIKLSFGHKNVLFRKDQNVKSRINYLKNIEFRNGIIKFGVLTSKSSAFSWMFKQQNKNGENDKELQEIDNLKTGKFDNIKFQKENFMFYENLHVNSSEQNSKPAVYFNNHFYQQDDENDEIVFDDHRKEDQFQTSYQVQHNQKYNKAEKKVVFSNQIYGAKGAFVVQAQ